MIDPITAFKDPWWYLVDIDYVKDGDTFAFFIDKGMRDFSNESIRLWGLDTWELSQPLGDQAKVFTSLWMADHRHGIKKYPFVIHTEKDKQSFNRYIADVWCSQGHHLADDLRQAGFEKV